MEFLIFFLISITTHLLFFTVSSQSTYESEPISTDAGKQIESINNFSKWKYISSMHDFSKGKSRMKDMGVLFVLLVSLVFPKFYSFKKLTSSILLANFLSSILIFMLFVELFDYQIAFICSILYLFSIWPYMIILHGGYHIVAQLFSLLTIYFLVKEDIYLNFFLAGFFMSCAMYSSASSRKYLFLIYTCLAYELTDLVNFKINMIDFKIIFLIIIFIFLWKSKFYFKILNKFSNKLIGSNTSFEFFSKIYSQLKRIILLIFFPLILFYFFSPDKNYYLFSISLFIIGFIFSFLIINYPLKLENIVGYLRYTDMSDVAHFNKIKDYFKSINEKIINGMRAEKSGYLWIIKYLLIVLKYEFFFMITLIILYFYNNYNFNIEHLIVLILIFTISFSPSLIGEFSKGPQIGRSYFPTFLGFIFFIGFLTFQIESMKLIYLITIFGSIYNLFILISDIIPSRLSVSILKNYLIKNNINEICTYESKFYDSIIPPLKDMMPNLKIRLIENHTEAFECYLLIPGQSWKVVNNFGSDDKDFDKDQSFLDDLNKGNLKKKTVLSLKNMGTSRYWMHEDEVSSYRLILLKDISKTDIKKSFIKLMFLRKS